MKHALLTFEENGYHDSYFYVVYFDDESKMFAKHEYAATAYAGGAGFCDIVKHEGGVPVDVLENARQALAEFIYSAIREAEYCDVLTPNRAAHGTEMRVLKDSSPRSKSTYKAGDVGDVFWSQAMGTFYKKGYNKPNRENIRVGLRLLDGTKVFLPLKALRLHREPLTDAELRARAEELSHSYNFGATVPHFSWPSEVFFTRPKREAREAVAA